MSFNMYSHFKILIYICIISPTIYVKIVSYYYIEAHAGDIDDLKNKVKKKQ